jgi:hypothetical protein
LADASPAVAALTGVLLTAAGGRTATANGSREGLEGAWTVQVTLRDCATNAAARRAVQFAGLIP